MVNRGANISWLSQFAHEAETLFGPLTGIEVLDTRIDGSVVEIICDFSINLTALTLEQVLGKRTEKVKKCTVSVSNQEKCAVGVHLLCSDTYQAPQGTSL